MAKTAEAGLLEAIKVLFKKLPSKETAIKYINKHGVDAIKQAYKDKDAAIKQAPQLAEQLKSGKATANNLARSLLMLVALAVLGNGLPASANDAINMCTSNEACTLKQTDLGNVGEIFSADFKHLVDEKGTLDQAMKDLQQFLKDSKEDVYAAKIKDYSKLKFFKDSKSKVPVKDVKELLSLKSVYLN